MILEKNVVVNTSAIVEHDCLIGDHAIRRRGRGWPECEGRAETGTMVRTGGW